MTIWDPGQYLKFKAERTRPSIDLLNRIEIKSPRRILDVGCGPGNSTAELHKRWPASKILGIDKSKEMIARATADYPKQACSQTSPDPDWMVCDFERDMSGLGKFDIIFSNAALHWAPNHEKLFPRLMKQLESKGAFAVQVPDNSDSLLHTAMNKVQTSAKWQGFFADIPPKQYGRANVYYDILAPRSTRLDIWSTVYYHVVDSHQDIIEWIRGTQMRPLLGRLDEAQGTEFMADVLAEICLAYKPQTDGKILMPFKRLFFVAYA